MDHAAITPIGPHEVNHLRDVAYRRLRQAILDGSLPSDTRLNERDLARALAISTTPIKDALRRLEAEGLTTTLPRRGTFVTRFAPAARRELTLARAALEGVSARLAAERTTETAGRAALSQALADIRACTQRRDVTQLILANEQFHESIHALAGSDYIARLLQTLRVYDRHSRTKILAERDEMPRALAEHEKIAAAILAGASEKAEDAMRKHVLRSASIYETNADTNQPPARRKRSARR